MESPRHSDDEQEVVPFRNSSSSTAVPESDNVLKSSLSANSSIPHIDSLRLSDTGHSDDEEEVVPIQRSASSTAVPESDSVLRSSMSADSSIPHIDSLRLSDTRLDVSEDCEPEFEENPIPERRINLETSRPEALHLERENLEKLNQETECLLRKNLDMLGPDALHLERENMEKLEQETECLVRENLDLLGPESLESLILERENPKKQNPKTENQGMHSLHRLDQEIQFPEDWGLQRENPKREILERHILEIENLERENLERENPEIPGLERRSRHTHTLEGAMSLPPKLTGRIKPMKVAFKASPFAEAASASEDEEEGIEEEAVFYPGFALKVAGTIMSQVCGMFHNQTLCDLVVKVEEEEFKCHKVIMAAMSGFFRSLLMSEMKETTDGSVTLETISAKTFSKVLRVIYEGKNVVTSGSVQNLLKASVYLQVKILEDLCVNFLHDDLDVNNAVGIWRIAQMYELRPLIRKAWQMIIRHFDQVSRTDEIFTLQKEELILILTDSQLNVPSEDVICDTVLQWVKHDLGAREPDLTILLDFICLPNVSGPYLCDTLLNDDLMTTNKRFAELVKEALCYHLKEGQREAIMARQRTLRDKASINAVVVLIGGYVIQNQTLTSMVCYDLRGQQWYSIASIPHDPGVDFATCYLNNELYVSGGSRSMDKFVKFSPVENQWYLQPSLMTGRECHAMAAVDNILYILGGSCSASKKKGSKRPTEIEGYDTKTGRWFHAGHLQVPVESLSASVVEETIYTFGGIGDGNMPSSSIQSFDTVSGTCSLYGSLPHPVDHTMALTLQSVVYIVCPKGQVLQFSAEEKQVKQIVQIHNMDRIGFGVYTHEQKLMIIGGEGPDGTLFDQIVVVDLIKKKTAKNLLEPLPIPMAMFRMETVKMPKRLLIQRGFNIFQQGAGLQFDLEEDI
ncbi:kelch-like protein 6 [Gigantopelta aegis]|uniref:kelch-like protein 6 n=1 Tax=Gigantopelta aegis TaxID=1735272 RepID=UPI001B88BDBB|nr:kelch-like protein 6 [Gigantopelta aegis]